MKSSSLLFLIMLSGCVATPKTVHVYDPECDIHVRKATLAGCCKTPYVLSLSGWFVI